VADYLHGYDPLEQRRLIDQAEFWSQRLILPALDYKPGERLLDVGCGVGAVLGVIGRRFPGLQLAGIDIEPRQIDAARAHLPTVGTDLRVGDARALPWPDGSFDHAYMMWFLEHLRDPLPALRQVRRVLRPGGSVTIHETDYEGFYTWPPNEDWDRLRAAQFEHFLRHGDAFIGRRLGLLLHEAGFTRARNAPVPFHHFAADGTDGLRAFTAYIAGFLEPAIPEFAKAEFDERALRRGLAHLRSLPDLPDGALTAVVYRATARSPVG